MEKQNQTAFFDVPKCSNLGTSKKHKEFAKIRSLDSDSGRLTLIDFKQDPVLRYNHIKKIIEDSIGGLN